MGVKSFRKASDPQCQTAEKTSMISEVAEGQGAKGNGHRDTETLKKSGWELEVGERRS